MALIKFAVDKIQGALFNAKEAREIKVYGRTCKVLLEGTLRAADENKGTKESPNYQPLAFGQLNVIAAVDHTQGGVEYLYLRIDGGLQGRLNRAEPGKDYDYIGDVELGDGNSVTIFGEKKVAKETQTPFIALRSGQVQPTYQGNGKGTGTAPAAGAQPQPHGNEADDFPF